MLIACAPAGPDSDPEVAVRELRVAQIAAVSPNFQQKTPLKKAAPSSAQIIGRDRAGQAGRERNRQVQTAGSQKDTRKMRVLVTNNATGEARLYDENNRDITAKVSPKTKKIKVVKDANGAWKAYDEDGNQVSQGPAAPLPGQTKENQRIVT